MFELSEKNRANMTAAIILFCAIEPLYAQENAVNETNRMLLACDALTDTAERLACFDKVIDGLKSDSAGSVAGDPAPFEPGTGPEPATKTSGPPADERETAIDSIPAPSDDPPPFAESPGGQQAQLDAQFGAAGTARETATRQAERGDQDESSENPDSSIATIVRVWQYPDGRFAVALDNGEVWRETQGTKVGLPREGSSVEITDGFFGGHRMKLENIRQIAWVRREK